MKKVLERLKSPVVIIQLISLIGAGIVIAMPDVSDKVEIAVSALAAFINVFAGLNNPTEKTKF